MDHASREDDARVAAVAAMLERERPMLTFDELDRVDRRLTASRRAAPRSAGRRWSRLAVIACLSVGLLFTTAGSGLALSGLSTSGSSVSAQYPDSTPTPVPSTPAGAAPTSHNGRAHTTSPSTLGQIKSSGSPTPYVSIVHAETSNELPFTGFAAIPILLAGIVLVVGGALIHRRTVKS